MEVAGADQEVIMNCTRCGGFQMLDRFYGLDDDGSVWMYDGVRCLNCGSINKPMRGEGETSPSLRAERAGLRALSMRSVAVR